MKSKVVKQKFASHYDKNNKTTFNIRRVPGVYVVKTYEGQILYVGFSGTDLYKALYRHFQSWRDKRQQRVVFDRENVLVRVIYCNNATTAARLEKALIIRLKPSENIDKYWINFNADEKEIETAKIYDQAPVESAIFEFKGDLPF